jgi:hypothetical protein
MNSQDPISFTAFAGFRRIAAGELGQVAFEVKHVIDRGERDAVLIFNDLTGEQLEVDFRGSEEDVLKRMDKRATERKETASSEQPSGEVPRGPGRPRLGVVAREVTLLPRHWEWLNGQPGGASVALRKLVEQARRANEGKDRVRRSQDAAYRFMSALAGNEPGFEEASRALFAGDQHRLEEMTLGWPGDVRCYMLKLAESAVRPSPSALDA